MDTFREAASRDPQAAVESLADQLLASPAYGERWAKMWLDLARYADSTGYGSDRFRLNIWPYRDWVINAFNRNLSYDQFTIEQIAGDLLPNATPEQITATAFHRNTMTNTEGGVQPEEYRVAAVKDRISTTGQVWMGLTVGCAQCHSHKFDPIPQTDYYRMFAVFNETEDANRGDEEPTLPLPTPEETAKTDGIKQEMAAIQAKMKGSTPEFEAEERQWEAQMALPAEWRMVTPFEVRAASGTTLAAQADGSFLAVGSDHPEKDTYTVKAHSDLHGITAFRVEALPDDSLPAHGPGRAENGNAVLSELSVAVEPPDAKQVRSRGISGSLCRTARRAWRSRRCRCSARERTSRCEERLRNRAPISADWHSGRSMEIRTGILRRANPSRTRAATRIRGGKWIWGRRRRLTISWSGTGRMEWARGWQNFRVELLDGESGEADMAADGGGASESQRGRESGRKPGSSAAQCERGFQPGRMAGGERDRWQSEDRLGVFCRKSARRTRRCSIRRSRWTPRTTRWR